MMTPMAVKPRSPDHTRERNTSKGETRVSSGFAIASDYVCKANRHEMRETDTGCIVEPVTASSEDWKGDNI